MSELELTRVLFMRLKEEEQKRVVKRAVEKGFTVDGFSKNAYKAPPRAVCACMAKKPKRGKYPHRIILGAMAEQLRSNENHIVYQLANELLKSKDISDEMEKKIIELMQKSDTATYNGEEQNENEQTAEYKTENKTENRIEELEQELSAAREKNKKYKGILQENKIERDNLLKSIEQQKKEKEKYLRQIQKLEKKIQTLEEERQLEIARKKESECQVVELKGQMKELMKQIEILQLYKEHAPKMLCIAKTKYQIDIPGYHIKMVNEWNEEIKNDAINGDYYKIWFVQSQFPYNLVNEISECLGSKLKQFLTIEDLMDVVKQGGR